MQHFFFIDENGNYYEGDRRGNDQEVPRRPSPEHVWDGKKWTLPPVNTQA